MRPAQRQGQKTMAEAADTIRLKAQPLVKSDRPVLGSPGGKWYVASCPASCGYLIRVLFVPYPTYQHFQHGGDYLMEDSTGRQHKVSRLCLAQTEAKDWLADHLSQCAAAEGKTIKLPEKRPRPQLYHLQQNKGVL